jgi:AcrR family transcriptional regulator
MAALAQMNGSAARAPTGRGARIPVRDGAVQVSEMQCARILAAAVEVVGELGYAGMSVARVTRRAGVSRRTFYDLFGGREDCFIAAFDRAVERASDIATRAATGQKDWQAQARAGLSGLLGFFADEPVLGALVVVHALGAGPNVLAHRALRLAPLIAFVDRGRSQTKTGKDPPPLTAEGVVGAVLSVIHAHMLGTPSVPLTGLLNPLMGIVVLPYLGPTVAAREMSRATPPPRTAPRRPRKDPMDGLEMRLTYRTLRVLATIAEHPRASNREIAEGAGINDQGQISRLLTRLEHLGLLENTRRNGRATGEANAWQLTAKGEDIAQSTQIHA